MELDSFWPARRSVDRLAAEVYRRSHLDEPWLTRQSIALLRDLLKPSDRCLEWGSGTSTTWFAARVKSLVSVEHDPDWFARVTQQLRGHHLPEDSVRLMSLSSPDPGVPPPYVSVTEEFADGELDVCFVDGERRGDCTLAAIPKLAPGGLLIVDDAHGLLDHPTDSPHSRAGRGPLDAQWRDIAALLDGWRMMWCSDRYSDTAIWIKPPA